jgi:hypothetical protein
LDPGLVGRWFFKPFDRGDDHARERTFDEDPSALVAAALTRAILSSGSFLISSVDARRRM